MERLGYAGPLFLPDLPMTDAPDETALPFAGQPTATVERDGVRYTLLGTAHVSSSIRSACRR